MENIHIIVQKESDVNPLKPLIEGSFETTELSTINASTLLLTMPLDVEGYDFEDIYPLWLNDIEESFKLLVLPNNAFDIIDSETLSNLLVELPPKVYYFTEILLHAVQHHPDVKQKLSKKISTLLSPTLVTTLLKLAENDMNMSIAAKRLYIHRNTMMYRTDQIEALTGIDPKAFEGLLIFYLLFKR